MSVKNYRPDIDGLRAIAVGSVVINHAFPGMAPAGFVGVDIFFVISGFLISSILIEQIDNDKFSILDFYNKRIRRIFPALLFVLLVCLVAGWWLLLTQEYKQLGQHIMGGAGFFSNFLLWQESGYFDGVTREKPLMHLWSLAVEEQFYLFWPLALVFFRRRFGFLWIMFLIGMASFVANIYLIETEPSSAFFLPLSRFWELMAGGILAYIALRRPELLASHGNLRSAVGLILLLAGLVVIDKSRNFPGWWALLPTAGTFLLISAGSEAWVNRRLLSLRVMIALGVISYPLYLWHWPLLSYAFISKGLPSRELKALLVLAAVLLAWTTYRWVEKPLRFSRWPKMPTALLAGLALVGLAGFSAVLTNGYENMGGHDSEKNAFKQYFENSTPEWKYFHREDIFTKYNEKCNFYNTDSYHRGHTTNVPVESIAQDCHTRDPAKSRSVLIWGDSHAQHLFFGLNKNLPKDWQVMQVASYGCLPDVTVAQDSSTDFCLRSNWFTLQTIQRTHPDVVIVAYRGDHNASFMAATDKALKALGARAVVFPGPAVEWYGSLPNVMVRQLWEQKPCRTWTGVNKEATRDDKSLATNFQATPTSRYISLADYFCNEQGCLTYIGDQLTSGMVAWDFAHLSPAASDAFAKDALVPLLLDIEKHLDGNIEAVVATP